MTELSRPGHAWPWPPGSATGVGSLPGTDIIEAVKWTLGELPDLPYLPELPARGPGADMIGRTAGLLVELPVELYAGRWRVTARSGKDLRRSQDLLERDLDAITEQADAWSGPVKVQAVGAFTLAASLDLPLGGRLLRDSGAVRDLTESLAEGLRLHLADLRRRLPHARILLQLDEPSLPAVLAGQVPTESGWQTLRAVPTGVVRDALATVVDAAAVPVVLHCCAAGLPLDLVRQAGVAAVGLDLALVDDLDALGEALDAGLGLFVGVAPSLPPASEPAPTSGPPHSGRAPGRAPTSAGLADRARDLWSRLGFDPARLPRQVVLTPSCGLAGAHLGYARAALAACVEAGRRILDEPSRRRTG